MSLYFPIGILGQVWYLIVLISGLCPLSYLIGLNPHATDLVFLMAFRPTKWNFFVHSNMRNAPYIHPRLDSFLELCQIFLIASDKPSASSSFSSGFSFG